MKKFFFKLLIFICLSVPAFAQPAKKIEAVKVEFITRKLDLTPQEAERFWPIYRNYQKDLQQVLLQRRQDRQEQKKSGRTVDELKFETEVLEIRKRYRQEFSQVLPAQKAQMVFQAEREFREKLIKQLSEKRNN